MTVYIETFIIGNEKGNEKHSYYNIKIGRSQAENDLLLKELQKEKERCLWFHLKGFPSPHGFLISEDKEFDLKAIQRTAQLIKQFSKSKERKDVSVEYLLLKYVILTDTPGLVELNKKPNILRI